MSETVPQQPNLNGKYGRRAKAAALFAGLMPAGAFAPAAEAQITHGTKIEAAASQQKVTPEQIALSKGANFHILLKLPDGSYYPWCTATKKSATLLVGAAHCHGDDEKGVKANPGWKYNNYISNAQGKYFVEDPNNAGQPLMPITGLSLTKGGGAAAMAGLQVDPTSADNAPDAAQVWGNAPAMAFRAGQPKIGSEGVVTGYEYLDKEGQSVTAFLTYEGRYKMPSGYFNADGSQNFRTMDVALIKKGFHGHNYQFNGMSGAEAIFANGIATGPVATGYLFNTTQSRKAIQDATGKSTKGYIGFMAFDVPHVDPSNPAADSLQLLEKGLEFPVSPDSGLSGTDDPVVG